jgi:aspartate 1-decarboxylase
MPSYGMVDDEVARGSSARVVKVDGDNRIIPAARRASV